MGLFDPPSTDNFGDVYPEGTPLMLYKAEYEGMIDTSFGKRAAASILVGAADRSGEASEFRVFGALAESVKRMESTDLPALVTVRKDGRAKRWVNVAAEVADNDDPGF